MPVLTAGFCKDATLTVAAGLEFYQVAVSADFPDDVKLSLHHANEAALPTPSTPRFNSNAATVPISFTPRQNCSLTISAQSGANLEAQPDFNRQVLDNIPFNTQLSVNARTESGWYRINRNGMTGWVYGDFVTLNGVCNSLPVLTPPSTQAIGGAVLSGVTAPYDVNIHYFGVDASGGGQFQDAISYPTGDSQDLVHITVSNLQATEQLTFGLTLTCTGNGAEDLRWGLPEAPTLTCQDALPIPFSSLANDIDVVIMLPGGVGQRYVDYILQAVPIAPDDAPEMPVGVDRDHGGGLRDMLSYPAGDHTDEIVLIPTNLEAMPPHNYRLLNISLRCTGTGVEHLRWGTTDSFGLRCGNSLPVSILFGEEAPWLVITIPPNEAQSYISYTLVIVPTAPSDTPAFMFGLDRDSGGRFNETISFPGDVSDHLDIIVTNLNEQIPNNFREVTLTLACHGRGLEYLRWGLPDNPTLGCGSTVQTSFLFGLERQALVVTLPENAPQSYINYSLVVTTVPPKSALPPVVQQ